MNIRTMIAAGIVVAVIHVCAALGRTPGGVAAAAAASVLQGTIAGVEDQNVTITLADGSHKIVHAGPDTYILSRERASLRMIKTGDPLAVTAKREADGALTAVSVNIFSRALWNRIPKGQWPMESGNIMTNALVSQVVQRIQGRTLYMKLDAGTRTISVPEATEIHRLTSVELSALKPGMRVTVRGTSEPDGTVTASSIVFDNPG